MTAEYKPSDFREHIGFIDANNRDKHSKGRDYEIHELSEDDVRLLDQAQQHIELPERAKELFGFAETLAEQGHDYVELFTVAQSGTHRIAITATTHERAPELDEIVIGHKDITDARDTHTHAFDNMITFRRDGSVYGPDEALAVLLAEVHLDVSESPLYSNNANTALATILGAHYFDTDNQTTHLFDDLLAAQRAAPDFLTATGKHYQATSHAGEELDILYSMDHASTPDYIGHLPERLQILYYAANKSSYSVSVNAAGDLHEFAHDTASTKNNPLLSARTLQPVVLDALRQHMAKDPNDHFKHSYVADAALSPAINILYGKDLPMIHTERAATIVAGATELDFDRPLSTITIRDLSSLDTQVETRLTLSDDNDSLLIVSFLKDGRIHLDRTHNSHGNTITPTDEHLNLLLERGDEPPIISALRNHYIAERPETATVLRTAVEASLNEGYQFSTTSITKPTTNGFLRITTREQCTSHPKGLAESLDAAGLPYRILEYFDADMTPLAALTHEIGYDVDKDGDAPIIRSFCDPDTAQLVHEDANQTLDSYSRIHSWHHSPTAAQVALFSRLLRDAAQG